MASTGYSGCLLGKTLVPDDVNLVPLVPPAIVEFPPLLTPAPGSLIEFMPSDTSSATLTFAVNVIGGTSGTHLYGRYFIDRLYPHCVAATARDPIGTCGPVPGPDIEVTNRVDGVPVSVTISNTIGRQLFHEPADDPAHQCHVVDLFVSSQFSDVLNTESDSHLPATPGDVLHVRWYVYNQGSSPVDVGQLTAGSCLPLVVQ